MRLLYKLNGMLKQYLRRGRQYSINIIGSGHVCVVAVVEVGVGWQSPRGYRFWSCDVGAESFICTAVDRKWKYLGRLIDCQTAESYPERYQVAHDDTSCCTLRNKRKKSAVEHTRQINDKILLKC